MTSYQYEPCGCRAILTKTDEGEDFITKAEPCLAHALKGAAHYLELAGDRVLEERFGTRPPPAAAEEPKEPNDGE